MCTGSSVHIHTYRTHIHYLFGLVIIDDIDPHSSRMGMRWCHGLLLWNLGTLTGHNSSHKVLYDHWTILVFGRRPYSVPHTQSRSMTGRLVIPEIMSQCKTQWIWRNKFSLLPLLLLAKLLWWLNATTVPIPFGVAAVKEVRALTTWGARSDWAPIWVPPNDWLCSSGCSNSHLWTQVPCQ